VKQDDRVGSNSNEQSSTHPLITTTFPHSESTATTLSRVWQWTTIISETNITINVGGRRRHLIRCKCGQLAKAALSIRSKFDPGSNEIDESELQCE
jgi:hypothetical protein